MIFLLAILTNFDIAFVFAALGSALGMLTALALGTNGFFVHYGLYGFNAVLCAHRPRRLFFVLA